MYVHLKSYLQRLFHSPIKSSSGRKDKILQNTVVKGSHEIRVLLLMAGLLRGEGGGVKDRAIKEKNNFFLTFISQSSNVPTAIKLEGGGEALIARPLREELLRLPYCIYKNWLLRTLKTSFFLWSNFLYVLVLCFSNVSFLQLLQKYYECNFKNYKLFVN